MSGKRKAHNLEVPEQEKLAKRQEMDDQTESIAIGNGLDTQERKMRLESSTEREEVEASSPAFNLSREKKPSEPKSKHRVEAHHSVLPLSMQLMKPLCWARNCLDCSPRNVLPRTSNLFDIGARHHQESTPSFIGVDGQVVNQYQYCALTNQPQLPDDNWDNLSSENKIENDGNKTDTGISDIALTETSKNQLRNRRTNTIINADTSESKSRKTHLVSIPPSPRDYTLSILQEYIAATQMYGCQNVNSGVLTALRFSLPTLRVSGSFHDADMLALSEVLFRHCNGALKYIRRLDFSVAGRHGKLHGRRGFGSHGAFTLSRVLCISNHIEEVFVQRNLIGPYGCAAIFAAVSKNPVLKNISMRRCGIGEKGALAFVEHVGKSEICKLRDVDFSVNSIGFHGSMKIEEMMIQMEEKGQSFDIDLEGNMVIQEIMNGITHGLGVILCIIGFFMMSNKVRDEDLNKTISCGAYSVSLLVLYISSTLYHSFFALKYTRYIFECLDHCAIYILITGSYTPFLRIVLHDKPLGSFYLLIFIYACCFGGLFVEAFYNTWVHKPKFSLAMYLGMGWSCMICLSDMIAVLPMEAINLIILGGIGYTAGVPFFVRNNNLDHSIWHCFVMAGSICHWFCIYLYVTPL